jgi:energy-converting hydrogenase Eha subunit E
MQDSFYGHKLHADQELSALLNLQKNDPVAIRSNLETALGLSVGMLATDERLALMTEKTRSDVTQTLVKVKGYRKLNPYPDAAPEFRAHIDEQLKWVPEK